VTLETLSMVPFTGEWHLLRNRPKKERLSAKVSPFSTVAPIGFVRVSSTSSGRMPRRFAAFTVCTFPGSSVRATTVSAVTGCPTATSTSPGSGSFRSRRSLVQPVTLRPGV